ncbi:MAG: cytochrome b/b6 domain-containing protein [Phycisphaerales bacterium]|nr:cytochrome b/b6 domain-containing protein [Phycisphaerales bacterium]
MTRVLVWDLPTRLFHWLLAAGFFAAAFLSLVLGDDSPLFPYHAILGLTLAAMVVLRIVWGLAGTRYARFRSFVFTPGAVVGYMKGVATGTGKRHIGHNPGSAYAIFAMLALVLVQATTGIMLATGSRGVKEIHEFVAYALLAVVGAHILGVIVHTVRHHENLAASMVHGHKEADEHAGIASAVPLVGVLFLILTGAWLGGLLASFDRTSNTARLPIVGVSLSLGKPEHRGGERGAGEGLRRDGEEGEDDD